MQSFKNTFFLRSTAYVFIYSAQGLADKFWMAETTWGLMDRSQTSSHWRCSVEKGVSKFFAIFIGKPKKAFRPAALLKRDSNRGISLWVLRNV